MFVCNSGHFLLSFASCPVMFRLQRWPRITNTIMIVTQWIHTLSSFPTWRSLAQYLCYFAIEMTLVSVENTMCALECRHKRRWSVLHWGAIKVKRWASLRNCSFLWTWVRSFHGKRSKLFDVRSWRAMAQCPTSWRRKYGDLFTRFHCYGLYVIRMTSRNPTDTYHSWCEGFGSWRAAMVLLLCLSIIVDQYLVSRNIFYCRGESYLGLVVELKVDCGTSCLDKFWLWTHNYDKKKEVMHLLFAGY